MAVAKIVTGTELFPARINSVHTLLANTVPRVENHRQKKEDSQSYQLSLSFSLSFSLHRSRCCFFQSLNLIISKSFEGKALPAQYAILKN